MTVYYLTYEERGGILIHTSVKLVTCLQLSSPARSRDFNPHEREARDQPVNRLGLAGKILIHTSVKLVTEIGNEIKGVLRILIHTSVKLVTYAIL